MYFQIILEAKSLKSRWHSLAQLADNNNIQHFTAPLCGHFEQLPHSMTAEFQKQASLISPVGNNRKYIVTCLLMAEIHYEKHVIMQFRHCANIKYLDDIAYYIRRLYGIAYCSQATNLCSMLLYTRLNEAQEKMMQSREAVGKHKM